MPETETFLVQRCLAGDQSAMARFVARFEGVLFGLCLRMLRRREDAEDAVQDTFARSFRSLHRWDGDRPLTPWLVTIAANRCRTALDRRQRLPIGMAAPETVAAATVIGVDLAEELTLALVTLRPEYRRCFELFYRDELSVAEVAQRLRVPEGTVKTWLHRARKELAVRLEQRGLNPGVCHAGAKRD